MKNFDYQFNDSFIHQRQSDGYVNLTEMVKAGDPSKKLNNYLRQESLKPYLEEISLITRISVNKLTEEKRGRYGGTWGHPLVAIDLAGWISAKFKLWANQTIRLIIDGKFTPNTDDAREAQEQVQRLWNEIRQWSIDSFWFMGDEMKAWLDTHRSEMSENEITYYWSNAQDKINMALFGKRAWQIRKELNFGKSCQIRDMYGKVALKNIEMVQRLAAAHMRSQDLSPTEAIDIALAIWDIKPGDYLD